ncbi:FAD-dependent oxidoreductase [Paenibacillus sp.]|uniref:FAD-dependent oxidoreductase n=1 Tax=Paenibacillus sp. TaxID=58172 RepID=UPI00281262C4|nr:FAD-dependent oxidoreductase [Paenibacillus sp.]
MTITIGERRNGVQVRRPAAFAPAETYDVIVVGLGTAGALAAIAAAERGLRVLGVERLNAMGGTGTLGAVVGYYFGNKGGLFEEIDQEVQRLSGAAAYTKAGGVNADLKKLALERRALAVGVELRYECTAVGVYLEAGEVRGLRWIGPNGPGEAGCRIAIDCTGDAEIAAMAGASYRKGRELDGKAQPFSNALVWINDGAVHTFYTDSGYVDVEDAEEYTRAILESACVHTHQPERFEERRKFVKLAPLLGVREGRFIEGERQVTFADFLDDKETEEPIFYAYSNVDNHGKDMAFESENQRDWIVAASLWGLNFSVPVPLGALLPKGVGRLLVAGRALAVDHDLAPCVRMKRDMQKCGEAAGLAAALAIERGVPLTRLPYASLKPLLLEKGCLQAANHKGMRDGQPSVDEAMPSIRWLRDEADIQSGLNGEKPGLAIWSAKRLGGAMLPSLRAWAAQTERAHLRRHSAFALALLGDEAALPALRETMRERDGFFPKTSRKYNQARGYAAIYLLGKLDDETVVPELIDMLRSREAFKNVSTDAEFINHDDEYFFQYFTFALRALFQIADRRPAERERVLAAARDIVDEPSFALHVTMKPSKDVNFDMADTIRGVVRRQAEAWSTTQRQRENRVAARPDGSDVTE